MIQVTCLEGTELDYWVACAEGWTRLYFKPGTSQLYGCRKGHDAPPVAEPVPAYSRSWEAAGPIIERQEIATQPCGKGVWRATRMPAGHSLYGMSPIEAALRCCVETVYGDRVEECPPFPGQDKGRRVLGKLMADFSGCDARRDAWV